MLDYNELQRVYELIAAPYKPKLIEDFKRSWGVEPDYVKVDVAISHKGLELIIKLGIDTRTLGVLARNETTQPTDLG